MVYNENVLYIIFRNQVGQIISFVNEAGCLSSTCLDVLFEITRILQPQHFGRCNVFTTPLLILEHTWHYSQNTTPLSFLEHTWHYSQNTTPLLFLKHTWHYSQNTPNEFVTQYYEYTAREHSECSYEKVKTEKLLLKVFQAEPMVFLRDTF